jgi:hypothetical protein
MVDVVGGGEGKMDDTEIGHDIDVEVDGATFKITSISASISRFCLFQLLPSSSGKSG